MLIKNYLPDFTESDDEEFLDREGPEMSDTLVAFDADDEHESQDGSDSEVSGMGYISDYSDDQVPLLAQSYGESVDDDSDWDWSGAGFEAESSSPGRSTQSSATMAQFSHTFTLQIHGPNPAGNRFGTDEYVRTLIASVNDTKGKNVEAPTEVQSPHRRRRCSWTLDSPDMERGMKRSRPFESAAFGLSTAAPEAPDSMFPPYIFDPIHLADTDVQKLLASYHALHHRSNSDLMDQSDSSDAEISRREAIKNALEKKAITTVTALTRLQADSLLSTVGRYNLGTVLTTEWWNDDVAALNEFYVLLFESGRADERHDWIVDTLMSGQRGMLPGKVDRAINLIGCMNWGLYEIV